MRVRRAVLLPQADAAGFVAVGVELGDLCLCVLQCLDRRLVLSIAVGGDKVAQLGSSVLKEQVVGANKVAGW